MVGAIVSIDGKDVGVAVGVDVGASTKIVSPTSIIGSSTALMAATALSEVREVTLFATAIDINVSENVPLVTALFTEEDNCSAKPSAVLPSSTFEVNANDMVVAGADDVGEGVVMETALEGEGVGD
jgi:hypothetical protein